MSPLLVGATSVDNEQHAPESCALPLDGSAGSLRLLPCPVSLRILASPTRSSKPRQGQKKKIVTKETMQQENNCEAPEEQLFSIWIEEKHPSSTDE